MLTDVVSDFLDHAAVLCAFKRISSKNVIFSSHAYGDCCGLPEVTVALKLFLNQLEYYVADSFRLFL